MIFIILLCAGLTEFCAMTRRIDINQKVELQGCYHCGEDAGRDTVIFEDKAFCCQGCKMVYGLLKDNGLCNYYALNEKAGISIRAKVQDQYAFLEDEKVQQALLDFRSEEKSMIGLYLPQIHCSSCLWLLENLNRLNPGITHSIVNFPQKTVRIYFSEQQTSLRSIVELLSTIGYSPDISFSDLEKGSQKKTDKKLFYQLGLAGFAFGNIMLLSFPEYLGLDAGGEVGFQKIFGYLNILLILPVIAYSGKDYFRSAWQGLRQFHLNIDVPISLGILALFGRSLYEILSQSGAGYLDSLAGLLFFLLIGKWFQQKTFTGLSFERDYKSYFPIAVQVKEEGQLFSRTLDQIAVGDIIVIRNGEIIPADATLLDASTQLDYSFVSGESKAIHKTQGELLYAGGRQLGGAIEAKVCRTVDNSYLTRLWNEEAFSAEQSEGRATDLADMIGKYFTAFILILSAATLLYWLPKDVGLAFNAFTSVLIVACPCAVALAIPFIFGNIIRLLGHQHFYLKNIITIEKLAKVKHIVFDKTGTLTIGRSSRIEYEGAALNEEEKTLIKSLSYHSAHPLSRQIYAHFTDPSIYPVQDFKEIVGQGISGRIQGKVVKLGSAAMVKPASKEKKGIHVCIGDDYKGFFLVGGQYRRSLKAVLEKLKSYPFSVLTGDDDQERSRLETFFGTSMSRLFFNQSPADKLAYIKDCQSKGDQVMMIGDGLNDAGALKQSDVGIVISEDAGNFTPASDAILNAQSFAQLPVFIQLAKGSMYLVYAAYGLALIYNIIGLTYAVRGDLSPVIAAILMPLSSITIVVFGLLTSSGLAWMLGLTKVSKPAD